MIQVSGDQDAACTAIQAALDDAQPGDRIEIGNGSYYETLLIDKPLTLSSAGKEPDAVRLAGGVRVAAAGEVHLEGLTIGADAQPAGLQADSGQVTLRRCLFSGIQGHPLQVEAGAKVSAKQTVFRKNLGGIRVSGRLVLFGCIVEETVETAQISVRDGGQAALTECGVLGGQQEGLLLTGGSRAILTKSSFIGNGGAQLRAEQESSVEADDVRVLVGNGAGFSFDASDGVLRNCVFRTQAAAQIEAADGSDVQLVSCVLEDGGAAGMMVSGSKAGISASRFKGQAGDQLFCTDGSAVTVKGTELLSGAAGGLLCDRSACTFLGSKVHYHQSTQLSARNESALTLIDCDVTDGRERGISVADSRLRVSDSVIRRHAGVQVSASDESDVTLSASEVAGGGSSGVLVKQSSLQASESTVSAHQGSNVLLGYAAAAEITDCRITNSGKNGLLAGRGARVSLERTALFRNRRTQLAAEESAEISMTVCEIYDGSASGLELIRVQQVSVADAKFHSHADDQVILQACPSAAFRAVQVMGGMKAGLRLEQSAPVLEDCLFAENRGGDLAAADGSEPQLINTKLAMARPAGVSESPPPVDSMAFSDPQLLGLLMEELDGFIGLSDVKYKLKSMMSLMEVNQFKAERGLNASPTLAPHMVFAGNPGTGKTTVARLMGAFFKWLGLLEKGHLVEVKREDLVGTHVGSSEELTKAKIKEAMGGVLFIDEAYTLAPGTAAGNDYGKKVIDTLVPAMENHRGGFVVIAAGYPADMERFLAANPGLNDRFTEQITFTDYTPDELMEIFLMQCGNGYSLTAAAERAVRDVLTSRYRTRGETFGNARMVRTLLEQITQAQSMRIAALPRDEWTETVLTTLEEEDVLRAAGEREHAGYEVPIDEALLARKREELHRFIGLAQVKAEIDELIELTRYYRREGHPADKLMNHTLLIGKPGTGKTEVARVLAGIYQALGLLERGELIEVDRSSLVGTHIGETEKRTAEQIERAMGSALFIDEAYTLAGGGANDYGQKAVDVLLKQMSDRQGEFLVLAAGYEREMEQFLDSNPGLRRRFGLTLHFDDYTPEELLAITELSAEGYTLSEEAEEVLLAHYEQLYAARDENFGNAGLAKKVAREMTRKVDYRLAVASRNGDSLPAAKEITQEDLVLLES
ncbi:right-handed parallel beta-helix repeat-containing protein [Sporosarcina trichiuri]|uniref:right-handed parallel beta-helix repeat-containing protein n=1 Tax=Sporosarcina trichiuri TaxID=3056445 RepID=UPI0025B3FB34|nr:right-handed parallel beta-helix repeat-containing protein [Sporosarcina sp. 0.2-SM1T-5]WJY29010.1 AAA family ATPase [Sporosarcina sp. 0.2-SM1T-5]